MKHVQSATNTDIAEWTQATFVWKAGQPRFVWQVVFVPMSKVRYVFPSLEVLSAGGHQTLR